MAGSKSTAYALVDGDVTQDADLLVPASPSSSVPQRKEQKSRLLLRLPAEVKQNIWAMAVTCDDAITPYQVKPKSNKFVWNATQVETIKEDLKKPGDAKKSTDADKPAAIPLTVIALTGMCKEMYDDISLTHLFYRNNVIDFDQYPSHMAAYLVAITDERRQAITSMHFRWDTQKYQCKAFAENCQLMALIASCKGLQSLKVSVPWGSYYPVVDPSSYFAELPEYKLTFAAMQGLNELEIVPTGTPSQLDPDFVKLKAACKNFKDAMADTMATERTGNYDLDQFRQAQDSVRLDIHGEGRLSKDKKPGIVSSRTRWRTDGLKKLAPGGDGVLPIKEVPKYDVDGMLNWYIQTVLDSRESSSDDGLSGVELQLKCYFSNNHTEICWEDASVVPSSGRMFVLEFYRNNPNKPGLSAVHYEWSLQGALTGDIWGDHGDAKAGNLGKPYLKELETVIKNKYKAEKAKEAEEAKAKAKADKAAAAKAKRVAAAQAKAKKAAAAKAKPVRRARGKKA